MREKKQEKEYLDPYLITNRLTRQYDEDPIVENFIEPQPSKQIHLNNGNGATITPKILEQKEQINIPLFQTDCENITILINRNIKPKEIIIDEKFFSNIFRLKVIPKNFEKQLEKEESRQSIASSITTLLNVGLNLSNISSIFLNFCTKNKDLVASLQDLAQNSNGFITLMNHPQFPFSVNNISSMLSASKSFASDTLRNLNEFFYNQTNLDMIKLTKFNANNISSILNKHGRNIENILTPVLEFLQDEDNRNKIYKHFQPNNLTSMMQGKESVTILNKLLSIVTNTDLIERCNTMGLPIKKFASILNGSGKNINLDSLIKIIDALTIYLPQLKEQGFSNNNVFSILNGAGKNVPNILKNLVDSPHLKTLLGDGFHFTTTNISHILSGDGKNAPNILKNLVDSPELKTLLGDEFHFTTTNISNILSRDGKNAPNTLKNLVNSPALKTLVQELFVNQSIISGALSGNLTNAKKILEQLMVNQKNEYKEMYYIIAPNAMEKEMSIKIEDIKIEEVSVIGADQH